MTGTWHYQNEHLGVAGGNRKWFNLADEVCRVETNRLPCSCLEVAHPEAGVDTVEDDHLIPHDADHGRQMISYLRAPRSGCGYLTLRVGVENLLNEEYWEHLTREAAKVLHEATVPVRMQADWPVRIEDVLAARPLVMTLPIGRESTFSGVVDLITRKAWVWDDSGDPMKFEVTDVPADLADDVEQVLVEADGYPGSREARRVSFTPDGNFILGEAPEVAGYYVGAGFNAYGIAAAGGASMVTARRASITPMRCSGPSTSPPVVWR